MTLKYNSSNRIKNVANHCHELSAIRPSYRICLPLLMWMSTIITQPQFCSSFVTTTTTSCNNRTYDCIHNNNNNVLVTLNMARSNKAQNKKQRGGGKNSNNNTAKGKRKNSNKKNKSDTNTSASGGLMDTRAIAKVTLPSSKSNAPPWQVAVSSPKKAKEQKDKISTIQKSLLPDSDRNLISWKPFAPDKDIGGVAFVGSYLERRLPPNIGVPEVAFLGRSNVGKSSLLNRLTSMASKGMDGDSANDQARVGKTPGATASVNLYALLEKRKKTKDNSDEKNPPKPILGFADLPGFGYAKLSKDNKEAVEEAAERYLAKRQELALGVLLVDARREPSDDDRAVLAALYDLNVPLCIVATKVDKLKSREVEQAMQAIQKGLGLPPGQPLCISSVTRGDPGVIKVWKIIMESCETHVVEMRSNLERYGELRNPEQDFEDANPTIKLNDKGELDDDDVQYDQGYDWIQNSDLYYDDEINLIDNDDDYGEEGDGDAYVSDESRLRMIENEEQQRAENYSMTMKALNERVRRMERRGEI